MYIYGIYKEREKEKERGGGGSGLQWTIKIQQNSAPWRQRTARILIFFTRMLLHIIARNLILSQSTCNAHTDRAERENYCEYYNRSFVQLISNSPPGQLLFNCGKERRFKENTKNYLELLSAIIVRTVTVLLQYSAPWLSALTYERREDKFHAPASASSGEFHGSSSRYLPIGKRGCVYLIKN